VPALGGIVLFAAAGLDELWTRRRTLWPATAALLLVGLNLPVREAAPSYEAELDFYRGLALDPADRPAAIGWYRRAIAKDPGDGRFWSELGDALAQEGRAAEAIGALRRALALDPGDQESARRLERLSAARGGPTEQPAPDSRPGP
jgi:tetratricopeptide (TPR) repeat protein